MTESPAQHSNETNTDAQKRFQPREDHPEQVFPFDEPLSDMAVIGRKGKLHTNLETEDLHPKDIDPKSLHLQAPVKKVAPVSQPEKHWYNRTATKVVGGVLGLTAAIGTGIGVGAAMGGDKDSTEPKATGPSVSGPETPGAQPTAEMPAPIEGKEILHSAGTAEEVLRDASFVLSNIINKRADNGVGETDNADLRYLTNTTPGITRPGSEALVEFVQRTAADLERLRQNPQNVEYPDAIISLNLIYDSSVPLDDGGFEVQALARYIAKDAASGEVIGQVISNVDPYKFTFSREDVLMPNGSLENTFVLPEFGPGTADPQKAIGQPIY